jgi:P-type Cu2+ transporter
MGEPHAGQHAHPGDGGQDASKAGHDRHAGHSVAMFRDKFWLSLLLTIPVVAWSHDIQELVGYTAPAFPASDWIAPVLGTIIFVYGGEVFLRGAWRELRDRQPAMMTLISLAISVALLTSLAATAGLFEIEIWWELSTLITVMLLGHWLEMRSIAQARGALSALAELLPDTAERVTVSGTEEVPLSELSEGDVVLVRPGARVPVDGTVAEGSADVDESLITGESRPIPRQTGDGVTGGSVVAGGALRIEVTAVGEQTALSGIMRLVEEAQGSRSGAQALADRAAAVLFYVALVAGVVTLGAWWLAGEQESALVRTATVLVIACPHALGLAIPLVISIATSLGARNGLLVRDRLALERARELDMIIFDKTGTLTRGEPVLADVAGADRSDQEVLALAAAVDADSEHPLARAIVKAADERGGRRPSATDFESLPGRGTKAKLDGRTSYIGGPEMLRQLELSPPDELARTTEPWAADGRTVLWVVDDGTIVGALGVEDEIRPESREAVDDLHRRGLRVAMITGDAQAVADSVARRLGIDEVAAQVLPADKADAVKRFQSGGRLVAMVGDGINDAPALATADVGIAIGAGTDVAVESADIVLVRSDPRDVVGAIELSRGSYRKMVQNLVWATGYNVVAIPLAAGILAPWGVSLPMTAGAVAMSASTIIVALNAQLLRGLKLRPSG